MDLCPLMLITGLSTETKTKQPKCPLAAGCMLEAILVYTSNGMSFSLKKEGDCVCAANWMILEDIMLSEISQSHKDKYCLILPV